MSNGFIQFKQGLPFFDMVGSFVVALSACPAIFNKDNPMRLNDSDIISLEGLHVQGRTLRPLEVYTQVQRGHISRAQFLRACCGMLANTAYESVKEQTDRSSEFEFLRHVRNASSHQNRFEFGPKEPTRPAHWRGATIDHTLKGKANPLQGTECFGRYLGIADILDLLVDIEHKLALPGDR